MFQKFNDMENFYNTVLNEKVEHQTAYVVWAQYIYIYIHIHKRHYSGHSEEKESGQLVEQLAVSHKEIRLKPNLAATLQSFLVSKKLYPSQDF